MATTSTTVHYDNIPVMIASKSLSGVRIRDISACWDDITIFVPDEYATRLRRASEAFNAIMQEPEGIPASPERSPEERAAAEAGYMPVSEYVERNS